eukprot:6177362-Pleurochrysis_carterae.AAC.4
MAYHHTAAVAPPSPSLAYYLVAFGVALLICCSSIIDSAAVGSARHSLGCPSRCYLKLLHHLLVCCVRIVPAAQRVYKCILAEYKIPQRSRASHASQSARYSPRLRSTHGKQDVGRAKRKSSTKSRSHTTLSITAMLALFAAISASPTPRDLLFSSVPAVPQPSEPDDGVWWDDFKASASDEQLYEAIFRLPKGGDTHAHLSGSIYADEIIDLVKRAEVEDGVVFMVRTSNGPECTDESVSGLYGIVYESVMANYSVPCQSQYTGIKDLTPVQLANLKDLISLHYTESKSNFFANNINLTAGDPLGAAALPSGNYIQPWGAYGQIFDSAWLWLECLAIYLKRSAAHNLQYVEVDFDPRFRVTGAERTPLTVAEFRELLDARLAQPDLADLDILARFQIVTLRFLPSSGDDLESAMEFVASDCNDPWVGVDIVGYETQDFPSDGSTYRFRSVADKVLRKNSCVGIGFHSGEKTKAETETELKYGAGASVVRSQSTRRLSAACRRSFGCMRTLVSLRADAPMASHFLHSLILSVV